MNISNSFVLGSSNKKMLGRFDSNSKQATFETGLRNSPPDPIVHNVHFWRNGFTINDGPLRRLDDPPSLRFLESVNRSECPRELEPADRSIPVNVNLVKRINEDWQAPPEPKYVPCKGQRHTLGTKPARPEDVTPSTNTNDAPRPSLCLVIDDAKPATSIQILDHTAHACSPILQKPLIVGINCHGRFTHCGKNLLNFLAQKIS